MRILIADDHAVMRQGLKALLEATRDLHVVAEARTGREAVARALELEPDVVIMDVGMPELNGLDATVKIRERCPSICVVILSMHADLEYVYRAFAAGAHGYLLKESAVDEIVVAVRAACAGRRYVGVGVDPDGALPDAVRKVVSPLESLSTREREVLQLVAEGHTSAAIAGMVNLSPKTVETYRSRIMKKVGARDLAALIKFAIQHGLTGNR